MWIKHVALGFLSLAAGCAVSSGTFAFLLVIGVIPRMLRRTCLANRIFLIESIVSIGVIFGAVTSVFDWNTAGSLITDYVDVKGVFAMVLFALSKAVIGIYGIAAGVFVGCIAAALAEILNTFPIIFHRIGIKRGLAWVMASMALGKALGALYYFFSGYGTIK